MSTSRLERVVEKLCAESTPPANSVAFDLVRGALAANGATQWVAKVGMGTPPQQLQFMVDSGTINTWITSAFCTTEACLNHDRFDPSASSTYQVVDPTPKSVSFGPWGNMEVIIGKDVLTLQETSGSGNPVPLPEALQLQLATNYQGLQFAELVCDGGLAVPSVAVPPSPSQPAELLPQLLEQGVIDLPIVSQALDRQTGTGEAWFGAIDFSRFDLDTFNIVPLLPGEGKLGYLWTVVLERFLCGDNVVLENAQFALDSGSSWFKGSEETIGQLVAAVTDNGRLPTTITDPSEFANYNEITVQLGGVAYVLTPEQYFLEIPPGGGSWVLGFHVLDGIPVGQILVGSLFMEAFYSVFFYDGEPTSPLRALGLASYV